MVYVYTSILVQPVELFSALKNTFKPVKIVLFFAGLIQNKTKYCDIKTFHKTHGIYSYNQWNYLQRGCMAKRRSGHFSTKTCLVAVSLTYLTVLLIDAIRYLRQ